MNKEKSKPKRSTSWLRKLVIVLFSLLLLVVAVGPWILGNTGLRDRIVAILIDNPAIRISSEKASLGYFSNFSISGLHIDIEDSSTVIDFDEIAADKSWLYMLRDRPDLGTFVFTRPTFDVEIPDVDPESKSPSIQKAPNQSATPLESILLPKLTAQIDQAAISVRQAGDAKPVIDLEGIDVVFRLDRDATGSLLTIDPTTIFDHQELTPELCDRGLQLVAPLLGNEIGAGGAFSFRIDKFQIPVTELAATEEISNIEIEGAVQLHQATIGLKDTATARVIELVTDLLGESLPELITVAKESEVKFHIVDGRVYHEGFALMLPYRESNVRVGSSGFVSLDGNIDVVLELKLPFDHFGESQISKVFSNAPIRVGLTGTMEEPSAKLLVDDSWSKGLLSFLGDGSGGEEESENDESGETDIESQILGDSADAAVAIADRISEFLKNRRDRAQEQDQEEADTGEQDRRLFPSILDRMKERRNRRRKKD